MKASPAKFHFVSLNSCCWAGCERAYSKHQNGPVQRQNRPGDGAAATEDKRSERSFASLRLRRPIAPLHSRCPPSVAPLLHPPSGPPRRRRDGPTAAIHTTPSGVIRDRLASAAIERLPSRFRSQRAVSHLASRDVPPPLLPKGESEWLRFARPANRAVSPSKNGSRQAAPPPPTAAGTPRDWEGSGGAALDHCAGASSISRAASLGEIAPSRRQTTTCATIPRLRPN